MRAPAKPPRVDGAPVGDTENAMPRTSTAFGLLVPLLAALPALAGDVPPPVEAALQAALEDEFHAEAVYAATIAKFGNVTPFTNIIRAERQHSSRLIAVMRSHGLSAPENPYTNGGKAVGPLPATLAEVCAIGVEAEIANAGLYDEKLLPAVTAYPDIVQAFTALRDASRQSHLPAFERCAGGQGTGKGGGPGKGNAGRGRN